MARQGTTIEEAVELLQDSVVDLCMKFGGGALDIDSVRTVEASLISQSNSKTGKSDSTIAAAIATLIAGYGQGGGGITIGTATNTPKANVTSIAFTSIPAKPKAFFVVCTGTLTISTTRLISSAYGYESGGSMVYGERYGYKSGSNYRIQNGTSITGTYNSSLKNFTVNSGSASTGGYFTNQAYTLIYIY